MNTGEKIRQLREAQGMTLEELGKKVGVGKSTIRKWETGMIANMRRDKIKKVADALGVSPGYLMGWEDAAEPKEPLEGDREEAVMEIYARKLYERYLEANPDIQKAVDLLLKADKQ